MEARKEEAERGAEKKERHYQMLETADLETTAWLWSKYGDDLAQQGIKWLWDQARWRRAAQDYRKAVIERYGFTRVLGRPELLPLEGIFTDLFILDTPTAIRRYDRESLAESFARRRVWHWRQSGSKRYHALRLITSPGHQRLFILGKPGAGKTTLLRYVALQAAQGKIDKVPIMVTLRDWDVERDLLDFIAREFNICRFPEARPFVERLLRSGRAIVLFDGLDEVPQAEGRRERAIGQLRDFADRYPSSQCLITCRIAATDYVFERFEYVELADFTAEQMRAYARHWFGPQPRKWERFSREFFEMEEHAPLRELGRTPILLSFICLAFDETQEFAPRRAELYQEAVDALLKKWDASRQIRRDAIYKDLTVGRKRQLFSRIAAEAFDAGQHVFRKRELASKIASFLRRLPHPPEEVDEGVGEDVLRAIVAQHGIFVEQAHALYTFANLTFQEYFTARYIVQNAASGTLDRLMAHIGDDRWREVFLLTASLLDDAAPFFERFQGALDALAAEDETLSRMLAWAEQEAKGAAVDCAPAAVRAVYLHWAISIALALALARARDPDLARALARARYLDLDLARDLDRALVDLDFDLAIDRAYAYARDRTFATAFDRGIRFPPSMAFNIALDHALNHALDHAPDRVLDRVLDHARAYLGADLDPTPLDVLRVAIYLPALPQYKRPHPARRLAEALAALQDRLRESSHVPLRQVLMDLPLPEKDWGDDEWQAFDTALQEGLQREFGIESFDTLDAGNLERYLEGSRLLLECLEEAAVEDRAAIKARLLRPPAR